MSLNLYRASIVSFLVMWMVPRGAFIFLIGMSDPEPGQDVSEAEFDRVLKSVKIEK